MVGLDLDKVVEKVLSLQRGQMKWLDHPSTHTRPHHGALLHTHCPYHEALVDGTSLVFEIQRAV